MNIRIKAVAVASILTAYGCGSSSTQSPTNPTATLSPDSGSAATTVSTQAQAAFPFEVSLVSVIPGTSSGDGDWCIGEELATLTAHVVNTSSQSEVTEGTLAWQTCGGPHGGLPKEACEGPGPGRWSVSQYKDLSEDSTPSITTNPTAPVLGFRLLYRPAQGSGLRRDTSEPFNIDTTCTL